MNYYTDVYTFLSPDFTPMHRGMAYGPIADFLFGALVLVAYWGVPARHKDAFARAAFLTVVFLFLIPNLLPAGYMPGPLLYLVPFILGAVVFFVRRGKPVKSVDRGSARILVGVVAAFCFILPLAKSASVSYYAQVSNDLFRDTMDESVLFTMTTTGDDAPLVDFASVDRTTVWYEADSRQDLRNIWRMATLDLGRVAWNLFGDGPDAKPTDERVWQVAKVTPKHLYENDVENELLGVLCEYRDEKLDRSNWTVATGTSLGDRPETAPLHAMCPETFNPDNEPLTPAWKFMRG